MPWFPDPTDPLSDKDAFDLANEMWVVDEMTKEDEYDDLPWDPTEDDLLGSDLGLDEDDW